MRRITLEDCTEDKLNNNLWYIYVKSRTDVGFIMRDRFDTGEFRMRQLDLLTRGNSYNYADDHELSVAIKKIILDPADYVFEFDDLVEMFNWLAVACKYLEHEEGILPFEFLDREEVKAEIEAIDKERRIDLTL